MHPEDVNGTIIGGDFWVGRLFYDGRQQGETITAESEADLKRQALAAKTDLLKHLSGPPCHLFKNPSKWELRIEI